MTEEKLLLLNLDRLELDQRCFARVRLCPDAVDSIADAIERDVELPPAVVFFDGSTYWLADGWHRYHGYQQAGQSAMPCVVRAGCFREARLHAASCNASHGLQRTPADKRRAVLMVLDDDEGSTWPLTRIAQHCDVSPTLVGAVKRAKAELEAARKAEERAARQREQEEARRAREAATAPAPAPAVVTTASAAEEEEDIDPALALVEQDQDVDEGEYRGDSLERGYRALRKAEKHARRAGLSLEELIVQWRAFEQAHSQKMTRRREELKRRALAGGRKWTAEEEALLGTMSDGDVARQVSRTGDSCTRHEATKRRDELGIPPFKTKVKIFAG